MNVHSVHSGARTARGQSTHHCYDHVLNLAASDMLKQREVLKDAMSTSHEAIKLIERRYIPAIRGVNLLKLKFRQYPAIHTNYSLSNCSISN